MNTWTISGGVILALASLITAVVLVVKARPETRKLRAEIQKLTSDGTAALLTATTATTAALSDQVGELQNGHRQLWQALADSERRISAHVRWDREVVDALRSLGGEITDPPPLYPERND